MLGCHCRPSAGPWSRCPTIVMISMLTFIDMGLATIRVHKLINTRCEISLTVFLGVKCSLRPLQSRSLIEVGLRWWLTELVDLWLIVSERSLKCRLRCLCVLLQLMEYQLAIVITWGGRADTSDHLWPEMGQSRVNSIILIPIDKLNMGRHLEYPI